MSISRKQFLKNAALLSAGSAFLKQNLFAKNKIDPAACPAITCDLDLAINNTPFSVIRTSLNNPYYNPSYDTGGALPAALKDIKFYREYANDNINLDCVTDVDENPGYECEDPLASLVYDVYYPKKFNGVDIDYSTCRLPAVIFAHSGGFSDCSSKDQPGIVTYGTEFAKRGFICFSCEYRRGVQLDFNNRVYTSVQQEIGMYRACQDVRGAIRTIIQKHGTYNGSFRINVNSIFLAGNSAGSFAMLNAAYYPNPNKVYPLFPNLATSSVTIQDAAGKIDADFYNCDSSIPYIDNILGILNCWGSISLPSSYFNNESSYFPANQNHPAVISFHGLLDTVFRPTWQNVRFAPPSMGNAPFHSESHCLKTSPFATDGSGNAILKNYGSLDLVSRVLIPLNVFY